MSGATFLDRDGVINRKAPEGSYVRTWNEFEFLPGAIEAIRRLSVPGHPDVFVVTNQRGIARRHMSRADVDEIHDRMLAAIESAGGRIRHVFVCPHDIGVCDCRKPAIGMFLDAQRLDPSLDLARSAVVGDALADIEAGNRLGAQTYLIAADDGRTMAAAQARGLRVDGEAASLLELVEGGALDPLGVPAASRTAVRAIE